MPTVITEQPGRSERNQTTMTGTGTEAHQSASGLAKVIGETEVNRRTNLGLAIALIAGLIVIWLRYEVYATGFIWAGACLGMGALVGFLFGIPKTQAPVLVQRAEVAAIGTKVDVAAPDAATREGSDPGGATSEPQGTAAPIAAAQDSNLEQISDWVTKLLVGGGLTQLQNIPGYFWNWGGELARGLTDGGAGSAAASAGGAVATQVIPGPAQVFATGLILYFLILGFFGGYLITLLQLRPGLRANQ